MDIIGNILSNVLTALYQPFSAALLITLLFLIVHSYWLENSGKEQVYPTKEGWKKIWKKSIASIKKNPYGISLCLLVFVTVMILFRTLLNRNMWVNPVSDIMGGWTLTHTKDGTLVTEPIENVMLFIPFIFLLFWNAKNIFLKNKLTFCNVFFRSLILSFLCSLIIEMLQLFLRIGTWQLSDLCYNTLGGILGGVLYWVVQKLKQKINK